MMQTSNISVETPENIRLEFELAGLASRFLAYLMDAIIQFAVLMILFYVISIASAVFSAISIDFSKEWVPVLLIISVFLLYEGYYIFFETYWRGQSVGNDMLPPVWFYPTYGIGSAVLISNRLSKRIGDFAAGTIVVREKRVRGFEHVRSLQIHPDYLRQIRMPFTGRLNKQDLYLVREFFFRKNSFSGDVRVRLASKIAEYVRSKLKMEQPISNPVKFLDDLMLFLENRTQ